MPPKSFKQNKKIKNKYYFLKMLLNKWEKRDLRVTQSTPGEGGTDKVSIFLGPGIFSTERGVSAKTSTGTSGGVGPVTSTPGVTVEPLPGQQSEKIEFIIEEKLSKRPLSKKEP